MKFIKAFEEIGIQDIGLVGGKNASLGEMIQKLSSNGVSVPSGFAVTSTAYVYHLEKNNLIDPIKKLLSQLDKRDLKNLSDIGHQVRTLIRHAHLPEDLANEIKQSYQALEERYGVLCDVAVRSSATAEDLPQASFAGQQETYLNVRGDQELLIKVNDAFASLFTNRAISYRVDHNFDHMDVALSVGVQKMVRSDLASSGVIFTLDTESGFRDVIYITSSYGLGENVVQGTVNPDEFYVHKPTLEKGFKPLLKKRLGLKQFKLIYQADKNTTTKNVDVHVLDRIKFSINDEEALLLSKQASVIEKYYSKLNGRWTPMDIEWAKDGVDGKLYIVQARPETIHSQKQQQTFFEEYELDKITAKNAQKLVKGKSVGRKVVSGVARVVISAQHMPEIQPGEILVTDMTDPDWEPIMKIAAGIITNRGGRTCHAAIVSRELGIPAIVGCENATELIKTGQVVTFDCSSGEVGVVYEGKIPFFVKKVELVKIPKTPVDVMVNVANPDEVFNIASLPAAGVGLARLEFIINNSIQIHPMALVNFDAVKDRQDQKIIEELTIEYDDKRSYFIDKLAQEAGTIAAAFYPKPVIIRLSDFKSNEYRQLVGGKFFEPVEENPMIGFRGASRYYHPRYKDAFALECAAMKKIRDEMGLTNTILMIPFVRTVDEACEVVKVMKLHGLEQGKNGLELYMMCEIPSNVLLIDKFSEVFDGFSIGSNDLTQMILAVDRDSELVANVFDERNDAVKIMLELAIDGAKRNNKKIGICGQAPSDHPEIASFLVEKGISSLSLNPDTVLKTFISLGELK